MNSSIDNTITHLFAFGNNRNGQLGCAYADDIANRPILVEHLKQVDISRISVSLNQSEVITCDRTLLNSGENDNNQLGG